MSDKRWVEIGTIVRAHGVRGWVRVRLADPLSTTLSTIDTVALGDDKRAAKIAHAEPEAGSYRLKLDGIDDRDAADALRGTPLYVERAQLPAAADDEVYVGDLVGCTLVSSDGKKLGVVADVWNPGAHELLVVAVEGGGRAEVPFVAPIVTAVDLEARTITCDPPEGLLDLDEAETA